MGEVVVATRSGKIIVIDETELPLEPRGTPGVRINGIRPGDTVVAVAYVPAVAEAVVDHAEVDHAPPVAEIPDDRRQAIIDVLTAKMPHLREVKGRAWTENSARTLAEMATDQALIDLVDERALLNVRLGSSAQRTLKMYDERDALDVRIANRVTYLFRSKAG